MKKVLLSLMAWIGLSLLAIPAMAQDHGMALLTGNFRGSFTSLSGNSFLDGLAVKRTVNPGGELLINAGDRFSFGVGFTWMQFADATYTTVIVQDRFGYLDPAGKPTTIDMPGTIFASTTTHESAKLDAVLSGLAYVNLVTDGKVRPFIGGGYGMGFAEKTFRTDLYVHPLYDQLSDFNPEISALRTVKKRVPVITGKAGFNVFPTKNFALRFAIGYANGVFAEIGIGFAF